MLAARTQSAFPFLVSRSGTSHAVGSAAAVATLTQHTAAATRRNIPIARADREAFQSCRWHASAAHKDRVSSRRREWEEAELEHACESTSGRRWFETHCIANLRQLPPRLAPTAIALEWSFRLPVRCANAVPGHGWFSHTRTSRRAAALNRHEVRWSANGRLEVRASTLRWKSASPHARVATDQPAFAAPRLFASATSALKRGSPRSDFKSASPSRAVSLSRPRPCLTASSSAEIA